MRDVIDRAAYRPFEGRRRVVIIDEADALVPPAQNALLKTLEEPPSASVFMLVTSRPDALLPTVRSRCPRLRFRPLDADDVAAVLMQRGRSEAEARAMAATADGSVGRALEASAGDLVDARDVAVRVLAQAAASDDPRRRIGEREGSAGEDRRRRRGRSRAAGDAPARDGVADSRRRASCSTSADAPRARQSRRAARHRAAVGVPGERGSARLRRSIRHWWRWSGMPASRSWRTGWCCSCESSELKAASLSLSFRLEPVEAESASPIAYRR